MRWKSLFFSVFFLVNVFSYTIYDLQLAVGKREQQEVLNILNSIDYDALQIDFKCEVILAYTDLYFWGHGDVKRYQDLAKKYVDALLETNYWKVYYAAALVYGHYVQKNYFLALIYYKKVFDFAKKAVEYGQDQYLAHLLYGILHLETPFGDLNVAKDHLLKALQLNKNHIYTYVELGKYYEKVHDCKRAKEMYEKALKLNGLEIWSYINEEAKREASERLLEVERKCTSG
ncbi:hypothetical protein BG95_04705 [Thermosipho sp. 1063]|nr:hypothetical protein Y592_04775 [Thermosipho sp. 1070]APT72191.1 hypothetical protein BG95_04705 [Thermosipho sp. 1063]